MDSVIGIAILGALYLIPTGVAAQRKHNVEGVLIVNILLGWTVVGWVIALVMACGAKREPAVIVQQQAPPARFDVMTGEPLPPRPPGSAAGDAERPRGGV